MAHGLIGAQVLGKKLGWKYNEAGLSERFRELATMQTATTTQHLIEQIKVLPPESLDELATYVEYLSYRTRRVEPVERPLDPIKLGGLLEGYDVDVSPEKLAETRREMWRKHGATEL